MNLDSLSFALAEISYSVANLAKKNFRSSVAEINHLVSQHGAEADRHLFRCLFSHVDFSSDGKSPGKDFHQTQFLIQECSSLLTKPNFVSTLCFAIDSPLHHQKTLKPSVHLFSQISKILRLTRVQEVVFGLALLNSSNSEIRSHATQFVKQKLPDLLRSYIDADSAVRQEGGLQDIAIEVLHLLLTHLVHSKEQFGIGVDQKEAFLKTLRKDFPRDRVPVVIGPLLYPETEDISVDKLTFVTSMPKTHLDASLADMILESGFSCTSTIEECRNMLIQFGQRDINPSVVAHVLGMMAKAPSALSDQPGQTSVAPGSGWGDMKDKMDQPGVNMWNVENFVQVVQDLTPHMSWRDVVAELDYPSFMVANKRGLRLLMKGLIQGLQEIFPVEYIYRQWKNTEGQLSFIVQSLRNPDVFCFADYPCHAVVIDILKTAPDDEKRDIAVWKSLDLVEVLLRLSEVGHYQQVSELFKFPVQNCPDMLVLALLQINPTWNTLKQELISTLMPLFLGNHPNSAVVLHYAWHCQGHSSTIRTLIMHSMAEWYMRGEPHDQTRLSRILDVAQDLKALSMLLNATPFAFVIDLACLASRREYLKLDKWLSDKIREHREPFIQTCVTFLKRRCPQLVGGFPKDDLQSKSQQLPPETIATMLACLQACASNVSQELSEVILTMMASASVLMKQRQAPVGPKPPNPAAPGPQVGPGPTGPVGAGLGGNNTTGLGLGPSMGQTNIGSGLGNTSTQLDQADTLGIPKSWGVPGQPSTGFAALGGSSNPTPGSPAKGFPTPASSGFGGGIQNLTSQLQNLSMPASSMSALGAPRAPGVNTLGSLSAQQVMKQQGPQSTQQPMQPGIDRLRVAQPTELASIFPDMNQQFTKEVEDEANSYFQRIYNQPPHPTMSIDEVLEMLKRFKDSTNRKEKVKLTSGSHPDTMKKKRKNLDENFDIPEYVWAKLKGVPVMWPVKKYEVDRDIQKIHVFVKADNAILTVGLSEIMPFPGDVSSMAENAKVKLKSKKETLKAFTSDMEWCLNEISQSNPKIIGDEVKPQDKPSHSFDAPCENTLFESSENEEEKSPRIVGDEVSPPEKPSHSFDATCEETHFESSETEEEKSPKIIGDEVNPPEKPSHSFDAICEKTHFESSETEEEKIPKIIGDEVKPPEKPSHSFDATCEKTHFESLENKEEKSPKFIGDEVKPPEKPSHSFDATCEETHFESLENKEEKSPKIIGDEVNPPEKPSHSFDATCEKTHFESLENKEEKSPKIIGDEVKPPEKPSHSFDATCEETHFESTENEEEKSPKIIGVEVNPPEKPSHSFDATCEETHFESSENEVEKGPKIIGDEAKPPDKLSHSFDATCENTHFESSKNEEEKNHIQKMEVKETVSSDSEDNSYESENENDSVVDSDYIPDSNSDSNVSSCSEGFPFVAEKFVLRNTQLDNNNNLNHSPLGEGRNRQCVNLIAEHDESNSGQEESHCNVSETVSHVEHCPSDEEEDAECSVTNSSIQDCNEELHCERSTPVPEKNRLYSGFTKIYIKKPIINNNSESGRGYDCVHACVFCKHLRTNIQAHLQHHSEKPEIKEIKQLQRKALWTEGEESQKVIQKIKQLQDILRNKGDHRHNLSVVMKMNGELIIARRSKGVFDHREYGPCPQCLEWIRLKVNYNRHVSTCPKQANSLPAVKNVMRFIFNTNVCEEASKHLIEEVFPSMIRGKITETAQSDRAIVLLGEYHFMSNISNKIRRKNYTSYHMRLAARLLHLIRKELNMPKATMSQVLTTGNFDVFVKCSLEACGLDEDEELKHPSTAVKMGHDIAKLAAIKGCCAIKNRDEENRKEAYDFEFLVTKEWKIKVKKRASNVLQQRQFNKKVELPLPDDIAHLAAYLVKSLKEVELVPGPIAFNRVAVLAEARLLLYNRRRPLEVEVLDLHTYQKRSRKADETDLSLREELTKLEKILLKTQELVEVRGKGNQRVPIILPKEVQEPLKYLADPHIRKLGGIKSSNNFLFANTGDGAIRPGDALNIVKYELDLRCPNRIVATKLRKHTATIAQVMGLEDYQLRWLTNHLGHTEKVHLKDYRATSGLIERLDISKLMLLQEKNAHGRFANKNLSDIQFEDLDEDEDNNEDTENNEEEQMASGVNSVSSAVNNGGEDYVSNSENSDSDCDDRKKKTRQRKVVRVPWKEKEIEELEVYFKDFLELKAKRKCPGLKDCLHAINKSKVCKGQIWKRSWETIKKKVSHLIVTKRQKGSSRDSFVIE